MPPRVIIVDDDEDTVLVFSEFLRVKGIDVIGTGSNGKEAVELYKNLKPDIAILDMKMPEYDGKYAIDMIKKEDPKARIIVVTGYSNHKTEELDIDAIFFKPYDVDKIIYAIKQIQLRPKI